MRIGIFLSVFDVHVNRAPVAGRVLSIGRSGAQFLAAFNPDAKTRNVQLALDLETATGARVRVVQITGLIARRIVCHVEPGEWLDARRPLRADPLRLAHRRAAAARRRGDRQGGRSGERRELDRRAAAGRERRSRAERGVSDPFEHDLPPQAGPDPGGRKRRRRRRGERRRPRDWTHLLPNFFTTGEPGRRLLRDREDDRRRLRPRCARARRGRRAATASTAGSRASPTTRADSARSTTRSPTRSRSASRRR